MGGDVAIEAAQCSPGRVAAVVWVDVYRTLGEPDDDAAVEAFVAPFRTDLAAATRDLVRRLAGPAADPDLVEAVAADMAAAPPAVALDALGHSFRNEGPVVAALPGIGVPVTAIVPADRGYDADSLARHGVTTVPMAGVGHFVMLEDPDRFNRVLAGVLGTTVA
jgi:pimeloyl-ACP methyl ester carboxylesterase